MAIKTTNMKTSIVIFVLFLFSNIVLAQSEYEYLIKEYKDHKASVLSVCFSPDGKYLLSGGEDKMLYIRNNELQTTVFSHENFYPPRSIIVTKENNIFFGSGPDVKEVDINNNQIAIFKGNSTHIWSIDYSVERNRLAAGSYDYTPKIWNCTTGEMELTLKSHTKSALPVAFSPDEKYIVSGSLDKTLKVWNTLNGELLKTLDRHSDNIYDIEFHPAGKFFASCSRDNTIRLWDIVAADVVQTFVGHDKAIFEIKFTSDGNHLLSASLDGTVRLWETKTGKMVYTFVAHPGGVNSISICPDGKYFASGGIDNKVKVWGLNKKVFVEYAFYDELNAEKDKNHLFSPRRKNESKQEYEDRQARAKKYEEEAVEKLYQKYIEELPKKSFK